MLSVGYFKQGFLVGFTMLIRRIMPALTAVMCLRLLMAFYGVPMNDAYVALLVVGGLLAFIHFPPRAQSDFYVPESFGGRAVATLASWAGMSAILLLIGYLSKSSALYSRLLLTTWFIVTPVLILIFRVLLSALVAELMRSARSKRQAVIAGVNSIAVHLHESIRGTPGFGVVVDGFFEDRSRERLGIGEETNIIGGLSDLPDYVRKHSTDIIFVAMPIRNVQRVTELLDQLHDTTASVYFVPDVFVFDLIQCRTVDIKGIPAVALCETPFYGFRGLSKRSFDVVVALLSLLVLSPVILITAILVKLTSPGPVIFKQRRYGLDGREIVVYKFRSMTVTEDSTEIRQATKNDERLTSIGGFIRKYSIDELPQLMNVLQGRMSIVGPRPHAVAHNEEYRQVIKGYMVRHKVAPGITGLAQVSGYRGETQSLDLMAKRIELDLEYLRNWSLSLDFRILFKTVLMLLRDGKAY